MNEKKRRWFQIHLSTAIVMMFVAGGLLWINMGWERNFLLAAGHPVATHGWPVDGATIDGMYIVRILSSDVLGGRFEFHKGLTFGVIFNWWLMNLLCAIAILVVIAWLLERRIRRREARKP